MSLDTLVNIPMPTQGLEDRSQQLEARVASLETELTQMKTLLTESVAGKNEPWWTKVAGSFENDPTFDDAVQFGKEWRQSAE